MSDTAQTVVAPIDPCSTPGILAACKEKLGFLSEVLGNFAHDIEIHDAQMSELWDNGDAMLKDFLATLPPQPGLFSPEYAAWFDKVPASFQKWMGRS